MRAQVVLTIGPRIRKGVGAMGRFVLAILVAIAPLAAVAQPQPASLGRFFSPGIYYGPVPKALAHPSGPQLYIAPGGTRVWYGHPHHGLQPLAGAPIAAGASQAPVILMFTPFEAMPGHRVHVYPNDRQPEHESEGSVRPARGSIRNVWELNPTNARRAATGSSRAPSG